MNFTKATEAEIRQVYDAFWENLLTANAEVMAKIISNDFRQIGTTEAEMFFDRSRFLVFMKETASQIIGNMQIRNREMKMEPLAGLVLVTEQNDVYVRNDEEWVYYSKCRISTFLQKEEAGWKLVQQHLSIPDAKTGEGETIALERISKENLELRDAVKRRTLELEQKNRELEIEASLEKVRTQALQMEKADNLMDICQIVYQELNGLGFLEIRNAMINIYENDNVFFLNYDYAPRPGKTVTKMPYDFHPLVEKQVKETRNAGDAFSEFSFAGNELMAFRELRKRNGEQDDPELDNTASLHYYFYATGDGSIGISTYSAISQEKLLLLKRFRNVFDFAYGRYQDIKQAEVQAKEAKIEAALERVRSRSLAMHHSSELSAVVDTLLQEFTRLEFNLTFCIINLIDGDDRSNTVWAANPETGRDAESYYMKFEDYDFHRAMWNAWKAQDKRFVYTLEGEEKKTYDEYLYSETEFRRFPRHVQEANKALDRYVAGFTFFEYSGLQTVSVHEITEADLEILERFGKVFEQSYIRFLDLQKAEAMAREAQIEAALERVRSKAMAMRTSEDIADTTAASFEELKKLGIFSFRSGVGILEKGSRFAHVFADSRSTDGRLTALATLRNMDDHPALQQQYKAWEQQRDYEQVLERDELISYYSHPFFTASDIVMDREDAGKPEYGYYFAFPDGLFYSWSYKPYTQYEKDILHRFRRIIALTFRRYLDLQKAEVQAREATKQASLDRVRAVIASMRTAKDLEMITPLVFKELTILDVPFIRCGVFIISELHANIEAYLSTPDGHSLGVLRLPFHASELTYHTVEAWRKGQVYQQHWSQDDFIAWTREMMAQRQIEDSKTYQGTDTPPESLELHFVPFTQGMLYVGAVSVLKERELELVGSLAEAFSIAYARYEDFVKLEKAKADIELTLTELKATQRQLIQSEKMASLGELTAGIAHEIQNPLNFVNNFSELSRELLDEMREAMEKGDTNDAKDIMSDVIQNLEKIYHHGRRADGIVKGMLQHSQGSGGQKELIDINQLTDEYLRLSYHGVRAKDKSFNATLITDYDENVGFINIIPQDIGRVILNLVSNAFYAVDEKKKAGSIDYEPTVSISTKRVDDKVEIRVRDNGPGIPEKIRDKIFQPFFTTKPTGEGTGLGLSLSYDIVKAHGGLMEMESSVNQGTIFRIIL